MKLTYLKSLPCLLAALALGIAGTASDAKATLVVTTAGAYYYGWSPWDGPSPQFTTDSDHTANMDYSGDAGGAWLNTTDNSPGSVLWHFQAAAGLSLNSDFAVQSRESFFGAAVGDASNYIIGSWSTDGVNYNQFLNFNGASPSSDNYPLVALSTSGYTGGSDLYVKFDMQNVTVNPGLVEIFRLNYSADMFNVSGTVAAVPEPGTIGMAVVGLGGLLALRRFRRNS